MKTNKLLKSFIGAGALAFALSFNFKYAINNYGILSNTLSASVLAQPDSTEGGSDSGGGSTVGLLKKFKIKEFTEEPCLNIINGKPKLGLVPECESGDKYLMCPSCDSVDEY